MFQNLTALGYTIVAFTILVVIGLVVIGQLGASVASCPTTYSTYNISAVKCQNATGSQVDPSTATTLGNSMQGYLGTSGLAGWTPAIVALAIGVLFLSAFGFGGKKSY